MMHATDKDRNMLVCIIDRKTDITLSDLTPICLLNLIHGINKLIIIEITKYNEFT